MRRVLFLNKRGNVFCRIMDNDRILKEVKVTENNELKNFALIDEKSNSEFNPISYFENEILFHFYINELNEVDNLLRKELIDAAEINGFSSKLFMVKGLCNQRDLEIKTSTLFKLKSYLVKVKIFTACVSKILLSFFYFSSVLLFRLRKTSFKKFNRYSEFALIHSRSSYQKIYNAYGNNLIYFYDSTTISIENAKENHPIFSVLNFNLRWKYFFLGVWQSLTILYRLKKSAVKVLGTNGAYVALDFFSLRIPHFVAISYCYSKIFGTSKANVFYSGEKESRYGRLSMDLKNKSIKAICIPHGLAYRYKYPLGIFGDKIFCNTEQESIYLAKQYPQKEFIYSVDIASRIFKVKGNKKNNYKRSIVYFTEPRRINVNVDILKKLIRIPLEIKIKLHPSDSKSNYSMFPNAEFLEDFDEAISNNICLARKSTILIEALYNNSEAIAILIDKNDKFDFQNIFPALSEKKIKIVESSEELINLIDNAEE